MPFIYDLGPERPADRLRERRLPGCLRALLERADLARRLERCARPEPASGTVGIGCRRDGRAQRDRAVRGGVDRGVAPTAPSSCAPGSRRSVRASRRRSRRSRPTSSAPVERIVVQPSRHRRRRERLRLVREPEHASSAGNAVALAARGASRLGGEALGVEPSRGPSAPERAARRRSSRSARSPAASTRSIRASRSARAALGRRRSTRAPAA